MAYAHGPGVHQPRREPRTTCNQRHPLLEDVRCQRLSGHPARHAASVDAPDRDMAVEWDDDAQRTA